MNEVKCQIPGCSEVFKTAEDVSPLARFTCKNHPRAIQVRAAGRVFKEARDLRDTDVRFQPFQFDKSMGTGKKWQEDTNEDE